MNDFLQMDIFFFVTTIFITILIIVLAFASYYIFGILSEAKKIARHMEELMDQIRDEGKATISVFSDIRKRAEDKLSDKTGMKSIILLVASGIVAKMVELFVKSKISKK